MTTTFKQKIEKLNEKLDKQSAEARKSAENALEKYQALRDEYDSLAERHRLLIVQVEQCGLNIGQVYPPSVSGITYPFSPAIANH